jgi:hypothetical protein
MQRNSLPDTERAKVTYDTVKEMIKERLEQEEDIKVRTIVLNEIIQSLRLELTCVSDKTKATEFEYLMLKQEQERMIEEMKKQGFEESEIGSPGAAPGAGATGAEGTPAAEGTAPPVEGATPPAEGETPPATGESGDAGGH